jgi:hypothetical protein
MEHAYCIAVFFLIFYFVQLISNYSELINILIFNYFWSFKQFQNCRQGFEIEITY